MKILITGAGIVGTSLAGTLSHEGHEVTLVDCDRARMKMVRDRLDVLTIPGNASAPSVLQRAGITSADMLIAVTDVDEVNLVVGMIAAQHDVPVRIVRLRNREYMQENSVLDLGSLGVHHVINPEPEVVDSMISMLDMPGVDETTSLADGQVQVLRFTLTEDSPVGGKSLAELRSLGALDAFLVLEISRGDRVFVPRGEDTLELNDHVSILAAGATIPLLLPLFHSAPPSTDQVIIFGASRIGLELAAKMETRLKRVVVIEPDSEAARDAAIGLQKATVLHGDSTDLHLLEEASIETCDLFCAVSDDDQANMLSALLAKKHSAARTAVLVHHPDYAPVLDSLGVERVISPRGVTVGQILRYVRRGSVRSVTSIEYSRAEIIELEVPKDCAALGQPLKSLHFPGDAIVGAVIRGGDMMIANGNTRLYPYDTVLVYAMPDAIKGVEDMFTSR